MPAITRINDLGRDQHENSTVTLVTGSPTVFADDGSGGIDVPASPSYAGISPPPVLTIKDSAVVMQAAIAMQVANPGGLATPTNEALDISTAGPELPDDASATMKETPGDAGLDTNVSPPPAGSANEKVVSVLTQLLAEAAQGKWKETGANPNIIQTYKVAVGWNLSSDTTAWCACLTGFALTKAGCKSLRSALAAAYTGYGNPVADPNQIQQGDIVIFNRSGGSGHVCFYWGPGSSPGTWTVVGGNQSNNLTINPRARISDLKSSGGIQRPMLLNGVS